MVTKRSVVITLTRGGTHWLEPPGFSGMPAQVGKLKPQGQAAEQRAWDIAKQEAGLTPLFPD